MLHGIGSWLVLTSETLTKDDSESVACIPPGIIDSYCQASMQTLAALHV